MTKIIDEYDIEIAPETKVNAIDLYGVTEDESGYILRCDDSPDFYSVYRIEDNNRYVCVGDFSDSEDAISYAYRLCEKYGVNTVEVAIE